MKQIEKFKVVGVKNMIMTFDFVLMAQRDEALMKEIENAISSQIDKVICTDIHKLCFCSSKQSVVVEALSENSPFHYKIVPKEIKYSAVIKMLNGNWESICKDEILDVE